LNSLLILIGIVALNFYNIYNYGYKY